jgi:hypothetical protein
MNPESKSRVVYENLDTTFVNLWALLRNLSQRGFIGRMRVELKDYTADVFMTGSSTPLVHEIDRAAGTDTLEEAALHRLVLRVRETPGTITVFEGADAAVAVSANADSKNKAADSDRDPKSEVRDLPRHYAPDAYTETEVDAASGPGNDPPLTAETNFAPSWSSADSQTLTDRNDEAHGSAAPMPPLPSTEPIEEIEWSAIVKASGELIGGVERALTGAGADFISLFNTARLELADDYTFLDPMAGEFAYSSSVATLAVDVPAGSYVSGLGEALRRVVDHVATGDHARRVRERVALELFSVARKRKEILDRSGFLPQLDRIAGTKVI